MDEHGGSDDDIEPYGAGDEDASLGGWSMSDDLRGGTWAFPEGTVLAPGAVLVVGGDDDGDPGPLPSDSKLSASGATIIIGEAADEEQPSPGFGARATDPAGGRVPDGAAARTQLLAASPGSPNR